MTLREYLAGRRVDLISPLITSEIARRVNAATPSMFNPMANGVGGWSRFNRLSLNWRVPMFSNGFAAKFWGRMRGDLGRTEIRGRFGAPKFLQAFVLVWYSLLTVIFANLVAAWLGNDLSTSKDVTGLFVVPAFGLMPLLFILFFNRGAELQFEEILDFLERVAEAKPAL